MTTTTTFSLTTTQWTIACDLGWVRDDEFAGLPEPTYRKVGKGGTFTFTDCPVVIAELLMESYDGLAKALNSSSCCASAAAEGRAARKAAGRITDKLTTPRPRRTS
jgi:hypothetical protein